MAEISFSDLKDCFYLETSPGKRPMVLDAVHPNTGRGVWGGKSLEDFATEYAGQGTVTVLDMDEATRRIEDAWKSKPERITEERFHEMLNILPPVGWVRRRGSESFKMSERTSGTITGIYCRTGGEFWTLSDHIYLKHDEIVARCDRAGMEASAGA